jgi:putative transposase
MTFASKHFEFMFDTARVLSKIDFAVPNTPPEHTKDAAQKIIADDTFAIFVEDRSAHAVYRAEAWTNASPTSPRELRLIDVTYNTPMYLTPWQIAWLDSKGRIRALVQGQRDHFEKVLPGTALSLSASQYAAAHRVLDYIDHYRNLCNELNQGRPSEKLLRETLKAVGERRGEKPLGKTTVREALNKLRDRGNMDRVCAVAPLPNKGNALSRFNPRIEEALQLAVHAALRDPRGTWITVKQQFEALCAPGGEYQDQAEAATQVSDSTIQRRLADVDVYTRTFLRYGSEEANRLSMQAARLARPPHPLDVVDIDHTELNVVVFDDLHPVSFGKPDILVFRDRHSGAVAGFHIGFESPSFASFIAGLKHTVYPKDPQSLPDGVTFPWYGMPKRLGVDNASHFVGGDMANAARELNFQVVEYRPGRPWEKGAMEHLFTALGMQLVDRLPGTTTRSPSERKKFDDEREIAEPVLTIRELYGFLSHYFAEIYNRTLHAGIGPLITLKETPDRLWNAGIPKATTRPLVNSDVFTRLVGYTVDVTVQIDGVRVEYLHYQSAELAALRLHPKHKMGNRAHSATKYKATRDPTDLARIWVHDPYRNVVIEVPVADIEKRYATGLTLYQHTKIIEFHNKESKSIPNVADLTEARRRLEQSLADLHARRKKHQTAKNLARFVSGQAAKLRKAEIIELAPNETINSHMNYAMPEEQVPEPKVSPKTIGVMPGSKGRPPKTKVSTSSHASAADDTAKPAVEPTDIEALKARHSNWED